MYALKDLVGDEGAPQRARRLCSRSAQQLRRTLWKNSLRKPFDLTGDYVKLHIEPLASLSRVPPRSSSINPRLSFVGCSIYTAEVESSSTNHCPVLENLTNPHSTRATQLENENIIQQT